MLTDILAARWLGHGRAVECLLAMIAASYGINLILLPGAATANAATADLFFEGYGRLLAAPLLLKATLSGAGLVFNICSIPGSRPLRFAGALVGSVIWIWMGAKLASLHIFATVGFYFCVFAALFSIRIMGMAWAGLPRPGAPGQL